MYQVNLINTPMCDFEDCDKKAIFEFTDVIDVDKDRLKTISLGYACDNHVNQINEKTRGEINAE